MSDDDTITVDNIIFNQARSLDDIVESNMTLKEINEKIILRLLDNNNNNVFKVAQKLNIGKSTIYRLLNENKREIELN